MLMSCANPDCCVPFQEGGRFFRFRLDADSRQIRANAHSVQHFWLCKTCSGFYTLECGKDERVVIRKRLLAGRTSDFLRVIRADKL